MDAFLQQLLGDEARNIKCEPFTSRWISFCDDYKLDWKEYNFSQTDFKNVPTEPGVYCFFVGPAPVGLPRVGYPIHAGKTARTLRVRYTEYLKEKDDNGGRVHVRKFLNVFWGEIKFVCAQFSGTKLELATLETRLIGALMPYYSILGYSASVGAKKKAWS